MSRLEAKVAEIISNNILAFNVGSDKGVATSDSAYVMRTVEVRDPDTGEKLGGVRVTVLQLRINHVQHKLCTAYVTSLQDEVVNNPLATRRTKKIVERRAEEKTGVSVYIQRGDSAEIEIKDESSEEPPF